MLKTGIVIALGGLTLVGCASKYDGNYHGRTYAKAGGAHYGANCQGNQTNRTSGALHGNAAGGTRDYCEGRRTATTYAAPRATHATTTYDPPSQTRYVTRPATTTYSSSSHGYTTSQPTYRSSGTTYKATQPRYTTQSHGYTTSQPTYRSSSSHGYTTSQPTYRSSSSHGYTTTTPSRSYSSSSHSSGSTYYAPGVTSHSETRYSSGTQGRVSDYVVQGSPSGQAYYGGTGGTVVVTRPQGRTVYGNPAATTGGTVLRGAPVRSYGGKH